VVYVATAQLDPDDTEWQARIALHQQRRPSSWKTLSVPVELAATIQAASTAECLLIDSLGTWLANLLEQDEATWQQTCETLLDSLQQTAAQVIVVAEETGWGVVPAYPLGRTFRDRLGKLTRQIGVIAHSVFLVTGGYALNLSQLGTRLPY
jgi:adenosylcobinamide kinase/adenosylcobinamide-phosphate guanylyltransferase